MFSRLSIIKYLLFLLILTYSVTARSQPVSFSENVSYEEIDAFVEKAMADWKVPGLSLGIVKNGALVYAKGYGYKDLETLQPVTENTLFPIGSVTKSFTAAAILKLQDDSLINIDKPVQEFLPSFRLYDTEVSELITARDLLTHRTGLPRHDLVWYGSNFTRKELYTRIKYLQPSSGLREKFQYQNLMYMTAGYLLEKLTGKTWEKYIQETFLMPLGMEATNLSIKELKRSKDFAQPYIWMRDSVFKVDFREAQAIAPAGAINTNITDISRWLIMNMNGGVLEGKRYLSEKSIYNMQTPQMVVPSGATADVFYTSYGMGWFITSYRGHIRLDHGGNIDGFSSNVAFYPQDSLGIIVLSNMNASSIPGVVRNTIFDMLNGLPEHNWNGILLEGYMKRIASESEWMKIKADTGNFLNVALKKPLTSFAGTYTHKAYGTMEIDEYNDTLYAVIHGLKYRLAYDSALTFEGYNEVFGRDKFTFITSPSTGSIYKVSVPFEPEVDPIEFRKVKGRKPKAPNTQNIVVNSKYSGEYKSSKEVIRVESKDRTLLLTLPGNSTYELVRIKKDLYDLKDLKGYTVKFRSDEKGNITEMLVIEPEGTYTASRVK